jgi:hypothetical protein
MAHAAVKQPPNAFTTPQSTRFHRSRHDHGQTPGPPLMNLEANQTAALPPHATPRAPDMIEILRVTLNGFQPFILRWTDQIHHYNNI